MMINSISISSCIRDQSIQPSTKGLRSSWAFRPEIHPAITHYQVSVYEFRCTLTGCDDGGQILPITLVGSQTTLNLHQMLLTEGRSYQMFVSPCFGPTCISAVGSRGILIDMKPAPSHLISCTIKPNHDISIDQILSDTIYEIEAKWEAFQSLEHGMRESVLTVYDWSLALTPTGGSLLIDWDRVQLQDSATEIDVNILISFFDSIVHTIVLKYHCKILLVRTMCIYS